VAVVDLRFMWAACERTVTATDPPALKAEIEALSERGVRCSEVDEARWGSVTSIRLPGGGDVGLYQPKHPTAFVRTSG
jgi:hypothetical protein